MSEPMITIQLALLETIMSVDAMHDDERGYCVHCNAFVVTRTPEDGIRYATADPQDHSEDCPWMAMRQAIEAAKQEPSQQQGATT